MTKPTRDEALSAIKTIIRYMGDDPTREGLIKTPDRVLKSYDELFSGYGADVASILNTKFADMYTFRDQVLLKDIKFSSFCEHHLLPITGSVDIAYIPDGCIIGISKLARLVEVFARRLQIQEKMTAEIAESLQEHLKPLGVAVRVTASHGCMSLRGVLQQDCLMRTSHYTGVFADETGYKQEFLAAIMPANK